MEKIYTCYYGNTAYEQDKLPGILFLKNRGSVCFYNPDEDMFFDSDLKSFDINDKIIVPFCYSDVGESFCKIIQKRGGIIPCGIERIYDVKSWPNIYKTKRKCEIIKGYQLTVPNELDKIEKKYGSELFFKTLSKNYSNKIELNQLRDDESLIHTVLEMHEDEEFIISEFIDIEEDKIGNKEYRVFVYDSKILSISRNTDFILHKIEPEVYEFAKEVVEKLKNSTFPTSYVIDLVVYKDKIGSKHIDVLEFNPICASGKYLYNSVDYSLSDDILHENITNIAIEKRNLVVFCKLPDLKYKNYLKTTKNYGKKGSFAYDLKRVHDYGSAFSTFGELNLGKNVRNYNDLKKYEENIEKYSFENFGFNLRGIMMDMKGIREEASKVALEKAKQEFFENLTLDESPCDIKYLCDNYDIINAFDEDIEETVFVRRKV